MGLQASKGLRGKERAEEVGKSFSFLFLGTIAVVVLGSFQRGSNEVRLDARQAALARELEGEGAACKMVRGDL